MTAYRGVMNTRKTPQSEAIPGSTQVANSAGGFAWQIDDWGRLDRFLVLGTEGGTFYIVEKNLTLENAYAVRRCIALDGVRVVERLTQISTSGRAAKNDPAIFALAMCLAFGNLETKRAARDAAPAVCRIGTHLFHLAEYVNGMRGWGNILKRTFANWYETQAVGHLAEQLTKYQQRDGWSHADLIKLSHPASRSLEGGEASERRAQLFDWALGPRKPDKRGDNGVFGSMLAGAPVYPGAEIVYAFERVKSLTTDDAESRRSVINMVNTYGLTREMVPTWSLNHADVWEALFVNMPLEAMIRNLGNMSKVGLLKPLSDTAKYVTERLSDQVRLQRSRIHPIKVLVALKTYQSGKGMRGSNEWPVVASVVDALDAAFYLTFKNVEPTGKNVMLALDVSGSMANGQVAGSPLTPREASAALALVTANTEPNHVILGFTSAGGKAQTFATHHRNDAISLLDISPKQRLDDVIYKLSGLPFGGTDCALPMLYAEANGLDIDGFVIYTDNETWAGSIHPTQALRQYRAARRPQAKSVVVGMTSNGFSIADPNDANSLDVVGMDAETPSLVTSFIRDGTVEVRPNPSDFLME